MIITQLYGGIGNQLFQYAAGRALAEYHKTELKLDISKFKKYKLRSYELHNFNISSTIARDNDLSIISFRHLPQPFRSIFNIINKIKPVGNRKLYKWVDMPFDKRFFTASDNTYLEGYWQSEKYFKDYSGIIRDEFKMLNPQKGRNLETAITIKNHNSVSIHVRRGDYLNNPESASLHHCLNRDYYDKCISIVQSKVNKPVFFVFSDNIDWCKQQFNMELPLNFIDNNCDGNNHEDIRLMSQCKHHIIANSTFSWWGAWLNDNKDKMVLAPKKWFKDISYSTDDLIPDDWIQV